MDEKNKHWQVPLTPEQEARLDLDLISELNEKYADMEVEAGTEAEEAVQLEQDDAKAQGRRGGLRLVGFVTVTIFLLFSLGNWLQVFTLPSLDFVGRSFELARDPQVKQLQQAVVSIKYPGSRGTGFNIHEAGLIVTNFHVLKGGSTVEVSFSNGETYFGSDWLSFPEIDLAIVNIPGENLPVVELAEKFDLPVGDQVVIIGNPLGFPQIVMEGEIAGQYLLPDWEEEVVLIKGPIHPGSSGSPVFNRSGQVVAIVFATLTRSERDEQGHIMGLAVPVDLLLNKL